MQLQPPVGDESESESETNEPSLWFIPALLGSDSGISSLLGAAVFLDSQTADESTSKDEAHVPPTPRRSTRRRRLPPPCPLCDHEIRGECGENCENGEWGLHFKQPHVCIVQSSWETKKFKMVPATFYNHLISQSRANYHCLYANEVVFDLIKVGCIEEAK